MPAVLILFLLLFLTTILLVGSAGFAFGFVQLLFITAGIIATAGLLRAARMLDEE